MIKLIPYLSAVGLLLAVYVLGHVKGKDSCQLNQAVSIVKEDIKHEKTEEKVMSLSDIELRKSYCQWVRDNRKKCLSSHIPIIE